MRVFNKELILNGVVIECETKEQRKELFKFAESIGYDIPDRNIKLKFRFDKEVQEVFCVTGLYIKNKRLKTIAYKDTALKKLKDENYTYSLEQLNLSPNEIEKLMLENKNLEEENSILIEQNNSLEDEILDYIKSDGELKNTIVNMAKEYYK